MLEVWEEEYELFLKAQYEWNDRWYDYDEPYWFEESKRERRMRDRIRMIRRGRNINLQHMYHWHNRDVMQRYHSSEMYGRYHHDNLKVCSCDGCCNPRRSGFSTSQHKLTIQERRHDIKPKHKRNLLNEEA